MAELVPARFADLVARLFHEPQHQDALFELPRRRWYQPGCDAPDLCVRFHGQTAGNVSGPAAGPHTQMAQNLLLSYVAGGRILELKTVQVDDRLTIPRPCIDITNIGYNVEWSQELRVEESLREYAAGAMLIHMFRHAGLAQHAGPAGLAPRAGPAGFAGLANTAGEVVYDISVGYDLAGIRSDKVHGFLDGMRNAYALVSRLRDEIPAEYAAARSLEYPTRLSSSVTLSTFHGCPADEIERICEFLIGECDFDVIIKMNPPMLGRERLEHILHGVLGYTELTVNPKAYTTGLTFDEALQIHERLTHFAAARDRRLGFKFSNTLEVLNHRDFFTSDNRIQYLSGQPLHVITITLADVFRQAVGPHVPISFSAGIDKFNFPLAAACGFVPITVSTDLLRPGGYGRLPAYLTALAEEMTKVGAADMDGYVLKRFAQGTAALGLAEREARDGSVGQAAEARRAEREARDGSTARRLAEHGAEDPNEAHDRPDHEARGGDGSQAAAEAGAAAPCTSIGQAAVRWASLLNTSIAAAMAREDPRYHADSNRKMPKRIDSHLTTFDCITCDKCMPVCPNAANFTYPTPLVSFGYRDVIVGPDGSADSAAEVKRFEITELMQIACYADFCNECGNCDTFCPEYGGPYIKKPTLFGGLDSWRRAAPRDGFVIGENDSGGWIRGRYKGRDYLLTHEREADRYRFDDGVVQASLAGADHRVITVERSVRDGPAHVLDIGVYHTMRHLRAGILDRSRVNQVNVALPERSVNRGGPLPPGRDPTHP